MKYKSNKYYQQITMAQFNELVFDEYLDPLDSILEFDELESKEINKYVAKAFSNYDVSLRLRSRSFRNSKKAALTAPISNEVVQLSIKISPNKNEFSPIMIYKLPDEWYVVSILGYGQFKCDQLEGLYRLIDDYREEYNLTFSQEEGYNFDTNKLRVVDMKYIKLYDGFDFVSNYDSTMNKLTKLSNDNYYCDYTVLLDDDRVKLSKTLIDMDDKTYNIVYNKLKDLGYININKDADFCISANNDWVNIHVYSCSDDWFIVVALGYYRCDQLMGVIKLIDDIQNCIDN